MVILCALCQCGDQMGEREIVHGLGQEVAQYECWVFAVHEEHRLKAMVVGKQTNKQTMKKPPYQESIGSSLLTWLICWVILNSK